MVFNCFKKSRQDPETTYYVFQLKPDTNWKPIFKSAKVKNITEGVHDKTMITVEGEFTEKQKATVMKLLDHNIESMNPSTIIF